MIRVGDLAGVNPCRSLQLKLHTDAIPVHDGQGVALVVVHKLRGAVVVRPWDGACGTRCVLD